MELLLPADVLTIMERTMNHIDPRLTNHGRRVAYLVYNVIKKQNKYSPKQIRDICIAALLHDVGAFRPEEVDHLVQFELDDTWDHSVYGYLFMKHYSPLQEYAEMLLYHHADCHSLPQPYTEQLELAQILYAMDRLDIYTHMYGASRQQAIAFLQNRRGVSFHPDIVDLIETCDFNLPVMDHDICRDSEIDHALRDISLNRQEREGYLRMIVLFIDIKSHQTVTHTIATTSISNALADLLPVGYEDKQRLFLGTWLHDIGKTGIPVHILEKPGKLTPQEMEIVKEHVSITDDVLMGTVDDSVRHIASRHHEKLNGSGYPRGLRGESLTLCERIAVVADIFSALSGVRSYKTAWPRDRIVQILDEMRGQDLVDGEIVQVAITYFDQIMEEVHRASQPFVDTFQLVRQDYGRIKDRLENIHRAGDLLETVMQTSTRSLVEI